MDINRAAVVAELTEMFQRYEKALVDGDNETLLGFFWSDQAVVRFGLADEQRGIDELRVWRMAQPAAAAGRRLRDTVVTTFDEDFAVITTGLHYPGAQPPGRQSQTWVRTAVGWRIVSAHVSWSGRR